MTIDCSKINVKKGSSGNNVKEVQKYLKYYEYYTGNIDGSCGTYTVEAIKKYQKAKKLVVDGVFGTKSCQASNINGKDVSKSTNTVTLAKYKDMLLRYDNFTKTNNREPSKLYIDIDYPYEYVLLAQFKDMQKRYAEFVKAKNREPKTIAIYKSSTTTTKTNTTNTTSTTSSSQTIFTSTPHYESKGCNRLGQCTGYFCFPHCLNQILKKFGITKYTEKILAGFCGTTSSGTSHAGGNTGIAEVARREGIKLKVQWKNFSDLGSTKKERFKTLGKLFSQKNVGVIIHLSYRNKYGHYETNKTINLTKETLTVLNSLGSKCTSPAYCGYLETRSFSNEISYIANTVGGQPSICIITMEA